MGTSKHNETRKSGIGEADVTELLPSVQPRVAARTALIDAVPDGCCRRSG
jgi:hypothetical protein